MVISIGMAGFIAKTEIGRRKAAAQGDRLTNYNNL
jgi:hypothetical protein